MALDLTSRFTAKRLMMAVGISRQARRFSMFKKKKDLPDFRCPLCEKQIEVRKKESSDFAFRSHFFKCERYKALLMVSALFQGLRLPKYGGALIKPSEPGFVIEKSLLESAAERFTEFMLKKNIAETQRANLETSSANIVYDEIPVIRVSHLVDFLMLLGIRIK